MVAENLTGGLILVLLAGLCQGSFMLPMKFTKDWAWENVWLIFAATAYLVLPWLIVLLTVPQFRQVLSDTSGATILRTLGFGLGWGLGALTFGLGVDYLGLALGFAVILGLTSAIGTLVPLAVLSPETLYSWNGAGILLGMLIVLGGLAVCASAGKLKEESLSGGGRSVTGKQPRSFFLGLVFCIVSGVLSPFGNLGFAFGSEITEAALRHGTPESYASNPLWAIITIPLFICNVGYSIYLFTNHGTFSNYRTGPGRNYLLAVGMGALWIAGMTLYGSGANRLGELGSSVGWAILVSSMVIVANILGVVTGEWKDSGSKPLGRMGVGLVLLILAIFVIGFSKP